MREINYATCFRTVFVVMVALSVTNGKQMDQIATEMDNPYQFKSYCMSKTHKESQSLAVYTAHSGSCIKIYFFPQYNINGQEWLVLIYTLLILFHSFCKLKASITFFNKGLIFYPFLIIHLYWEVSFNSMAAIILRTGGITSQAIGQAIHFIIISTVIIFLNFLDRSRISNLQKILSFLFQAIIYCFSATNLYLFYRITTISLILSPLLQIYYTNTSKDDKLGSSSVYLIHNVTICIFSWVQVGFSYITIDPFLYQNQVTISIIAILMMSIAFLFNKTGIRIMYECWIWNKSIFSKLNKWIDHKIGKIKVGTDLCPICLVQMDPYLAVLQVTSRIDIITSMSGLIVKTPCNHIYHAQCLNLWVCLGYQKTCPVDNREIPLIA